MSKIVILLVIVAAVTQVYSASIGAGDDIASAAARGDWDAVHRMINQRFQSTDIWAPLPGGSVRDLKPVNGGHVYGEAEYVYHGASNVNGKKSETSGGHKVVNIDGHTQEFDIKPNF